MKVVFLDAATVGDDISLDVFSRFGSLTVFPMTSPDEVAAHVADAEIVLTNKVRLNGETLAGCENVRYIGVAATGFDNIDLDYARARNIAVCNVKGYSTDSVAQVTAGLALSLVNHLTEYDRYCKDGRYTKSGIHNCLVPVVHEFAGKTWGLYGYGDIGKKVADIARALGCRILACKRTPEPGVECVSLDELFRRSDILSVHTPLNEQTKRSVDRAVLGNARSSLVLINAARGAVLDESAVAEALLSGRIAAFGTDVYDGEPMRADSPFQALTGCDNVLFTPHMAWGSYEARVRLLDEMALNVDAFLNGERRGRVD